MDVPNVEIRPAGEPDADSVAQLVFELLEELASPRNSDYELEAVTRTARSFLKGGDRVWAFLAEAGGQAIGVITLGGYLLSHDEVGRLTSASTRRRAGTLAQGCGPALARHGRIRAERQRRLRTLLGAARAGSSGHRQRLADIDPETATEADLGRVPPMTKDDMMENLDGIFTDPRLSRGLVEAHLETLTTDAYLLDEFHVFASGGSSGRRGVFVWDSNGWLWFALALSSALRVRSSAASEQSFVVSIFAGPRSS